MINNQVRILGNAFGSGTKSCVVMEKSWTSKV